MLPDLPAEIWTQIFDLAADEDILFQHGIPTVMAESAWYKDFIVDQWRLRSPQEAMNLLQRRSYDTKRAIISTCRQWRTWGSEFLFRCLYFHKPSKFDSLCSILDASSSRSTTVTSSYGWWSRRLHISRDYHTAFGGSKATMEDTEDALVSIIRHCPNLEIFVIERPMGAAFGPVVDALATYAFRNLHTVQWNIPGESLSKVIWALNALPNIIAAHIDVDTSVPIVQEIANLGSASNIHLKLPYLQQLSLRGYVEELVEQAAGWELPSLRSFSVDSGSSSHDVPDVAEFLKLHGTDLVLLDLNLDPFVDVPLILDLCPNLSTFTFNADWRITPHDDVSSDLVNRPHQHITTIGLHGLSYAFGVGYTAVRASVDPLRARMVTRSNDLNVAALNKLNFPKLQCVRALSRTMLNDLNRENGPSLENGGYNRWNKWWNACTGAGIRLEDCTGQTLGTLPQDEEEVESDEEEAQEEEEEEVSEEEEEEEDSDEWGTGSEEAEDGWDSDAPQFPAPSGRTMELTRLLQEVRAMNETRDEALIKRIRIPRPPSPLDP